MSHSISTICYLCESGFRPGSVGGLQAPTNCMRSNLTQVWSDVRKKPPYSSIWRRNEITRCVPEKSENITSHTYDKIVLKHISF